KDFIPHASFYLDEIIENEINHLTSLRATSDSDPESENRDYKKIRFVRKMELSEEDL
ncbi:8610_t:CDS:1, partial [Rhizophagus irregularis]